MAIEPGARLGPYEITSAIGSGGMGEVWRARDTRLDRTVAIKLMRGTTEAQRQRFEREGRAVAALQHPHICALFDLGKHEGTDYLVMEHLEGETLEQRLAKGALPLAQALQYAIQIAGALDQAHRTGVVHRDLKPANVMLTRDGVKLLDFGLAKVAAKAAVQAGEHELTLTVAITGESTIIGTVPYMAPEQVEGKEADARTDIFAFGAVLYEMITGRRAFTGKSATSVLAAVLEHDPPPVSQARPLTPPALDAFVKTCLAKNPEERWHCARDLVLQLRALAVVPVDAPRRVPGSRLPWIVAAGLMFVVATAFGTYLWLRPKPEHRPYWFSVAPPPKSNFVFSTNQGGSAISPDGRTLAFVADQQGVEMLWVRPLDTREPRSLPGTEGAHYPFWSPNSRSIAFFARGQLFRVDLAAGAPRVICDAPAVGRGGSWGSQGDILFVSTRERSVMRVSAAGGKPVPATELQSSRQESRHYWPHFLPDGHHFLYTSSGSEETLGIYYGSTLSKPESQPKVRLVAELSNAAYAPPRDGQSGHMLLHRNGEIIAVPFDSQGLKVLGEPVPIASAAAFLPNLMLADFSVSMDGLLVLNSSQSRQRSTLTWVSREGKTLGTIGTPDYYFDLALSPDGSKVAVVRRTLTDADIWIVDLSRGSASRLTFEREQEISPVWSPDGSRLAYYRSLNGVMVKDINGAGIQHLLLDGRGTLKIPTSWSPDGSSVLISEQVRTQSVVARLNASGPEQGKTFPLLSSPFTIYGGNFSPRGEFVSYTRTESGRPEVFVSPIHGKSLAPGKWQISTKGGHSSKWHPNGKEIFFVSSERKLMAVELDIAGGGLSPGIPKELFPLSSSGEFDVARDGKRFLILTPVEDAQPEPLAVLVNWQAAVGR